jgi:hypothetical protein
VHPNLDDLRRYAVARSLFKPTTLVRAVNKLGFVQADPIRAPARAQDLILRHRVTNYRVGDLERRYRKLPLEEDFFVNYGFMPRELQQLMHPRRLDKPWPAKQQRQAQQILEFIAARGPSHPREIDQHFRHGQITNWFGGTSNASTHLLEAMHYRGLLRVSHRNKGIRVYAMATPLSDDCNAAAAPARMDALIDVIVSKYAPLPAASLGQLVRFLLRGVPQFAADKSAALARAKKRLAGCRIDSVDWQWPANENPMSQRWRVAPEARLLAPFDPIVWDRRRFELFWKWAYRFEAYTPPAKRNLGYYALPLLWHDRIVGWGNVTLRNRELTSEFGYVAKGVARDRALRAALNAELDRMRAFLEQNEEAS